MEDLDTCLSLLGQKSDENKFVALFLLPRLLPDPNDHLRIQHAFSRMNFKFLKRLLGTEDLASSTGSTVPAITLHSISVNIISGFFRIPKLSGRQELLDLIPGLTKLLQLHASDKAYMEIIGDVLQCLFSLVGSEDNANLEILFQGATLQALSTLLEKGANEEARKQTLGLISAIFATSLLSSGVLNPKATSQSIQSVIATLVRTIKSNETILKFHAIDTLTYVLNACSQCEDLSLNKDTQNILSELSIGLSPVLKSKIGVKERDSVLILFSKALLCTGPSLFKVSSSADNPRHQFTTLLVHAACTETRVRLDEFSKENVLSSEAVVTSSFHIIESFLASLIAADKSDETIHMAGDQLLSIRSASADAFTSFMASLLDRFDVFLEANDEKVLNNPIVISGLRALALWLSEETELPTPELISCIPCILAICAREQPVARYFGHAFVNVTSETELRDAFLASGGLKIILAALSSDEMDIANEGLPWLESLLNCMVTTERLDISASQISFLLEKASSLSSGKAKDIPYDRALSGAYIASILIDAILIDQTVHSDDEYCQKMVDTSLSILSMLPVSSFKTEGWSEIGDLFDHAVEVILNLQASRSSVKKFLFASPFAESFQITRLPSGTNSILARSLSTKASEGALVDTTKKESAILPVELISGVPPEVTRRSVRIYRPANTPTQSGSARPNHWKIDFDVKERWENPLMGWASSADPVQALNIKFLTKEDAILFAERQGYDYWIDLPKEAKFVPKLYADNFKYYPGKLRLIRTK
ncbi:hypothetical protein HDU97_010160 [Phlyctochytrium planicorne]|nr:hypothetical protein HDU97_010160 [Phlyctochytrium planicorne]